MYIKSSRNNIFEQLKHICNSNKDEKNTLLSQLWRLVSGPMTLLLIPLFLNQTDQGLWYTFIGISALGIFADLGFTSIVLQFSAHEYAHLKFNDQELVGADFHLARLSSLYKFVIRWSTKMTLFVFPIIMVIGIVLFRTRTNDYSWLFPWFIYLIASAFVFIASVLSSFVQGLDNVAKVQRIILIQSICTTLFLLIFFILDFGLYSLGLSQLVGVLVFFLFLKKDFGRTIYQLKKTHELVFNWKKDVLPLLFKYALSWGSGYLVFQIYTPIMFYFSGPIEAGKVGITITLVNAIYSISNVWFVAKIPKFNILVAEKKWRSLDFLFNKTLKNTLITYIFGALSMFTIILVFKGNIVIFDKITERFMGIIPLTMLLACWFFQIFISGSAIYLRAHKKEVYVYISIINALYVLFSTFLCSVLLNGEYIFLGFLSSYLLFGYSFYKIYQKSRAEWHH